MGGGEVGAMVVVVVGDHGGGGVAQIPRERLDKAVSFTPRTACARRRRCNAMLNIPPQSPALGGGARGLPGDRFSRSDALRLSRGERRETGGCDR